MLTDEKRSLDTAAGNKIWCDGDVVRYIISSPVDEKEASLLSGEGTKFVDNGGASFVVIDLKQSTKFSSDARKIWVKFLQNDKIKKAAIFGGNVFVRTLASFVIAASQKRNIKFFTTEEEAMAWLRE